MIKNRAAEKLVKAEIIKSTLITGHPSRLIICLDDSYPLASDVVRHNPKIRVTNGTYFIKYEPNGNFAHCNGGFHFIIGNDLLGFVLKVRNSEHFEKLADVFPEVAWMLRHTNYNPRMFFVAKLHPGMMIHFCVDFGKYIDELIPQMEKDGINIHENKPFITFKSRIEDINYIINDKEYAPTFGQYAEKIAEAKRIAAECDEQK